MLHQVRREDQREHAGASWRATGDGRLAETARGGDRVRGSVESLEGCEEGEEGFAAVEWIPV